MQSPKSLYNPYKPSFRYLFIINTMAKDNLETRAKKSVIRIEKGVSGIYNVLTDFNLKLSHIIERMGNQYEGSNSSSYYTDS